MMGRNKGGLNFHGRAPQFPDQGKPWQKNASSMVENPRITDAKNSENYFHVALGPMVSMLACHPADLGSFTH